MRGTYGYFDDDAREYVITRPDTPLPWLNYLGQDELFGVCTNTGGGYTFWRDARLRRLTRHRYNNVPYDLGGRCIYVRDGTTVWNPGWQPTKTPLDRYECRHGLGYTRIVGEKDGVEVELLFFVVPGENVELWRTTVRNTSDEPRSLTLFSYVEFCFYEALNDMTNFQRTYSIGEVEVEGSAIYHTTEYRERRDHYTLFGCTREIDGFDTSRDVFVGVHNGLHEAVVPFAGAARSSVAHGWNPIGSHQLDVHLAARGEESFAFVLAYVEQGDEPKFERPGVANKERGRALLARFRHEGAVDDAFASLRTFWKDLLSGFQAECPEPNARRMLNTWNQYECMTTFNLSRSASFYETGIGRGMGFRDSNQDLLGFVHLVPRRARERILDLAATQLADGTCFHQYQPLTKRGNAEIGGGFNDDHLWLILSTCAYVKETGDTSILDERVGYADTPGSGESLLHHLETSIAYTLGHRGDHGLPLIGHADWNDCLNLNCFSTEPDEPFQTAGDIEGSRAESVMIAGLFLYACRELAGLYRHLGKPEEATRVDLRYADMHAVVEEHAWDGAWYLRAFDASGAPVGSHECEEGKIFVESQGWCVLGGAGRRQRASPARARERPRAPVHGARRRSSAARLQPLPPRARRDLQLPTRLTRRTQGSSATRTRGSPSVGACWARAIARWSTTSRRVRRRTRIGSRPTGPSRTSTRRRSQAPTPRRRERRRTRGSRARRRGASSRSPRASSGSSPTTPGCGSTRASRAPGARTGSPGASAGSSTRSRSRTPTVSAAACAR